MYSKTEIQAIAKKLGLRPSRSQGQNFLIDQEALNDIVATADIQPGDKILEVGPGFGSLTFPLLEAGAEVHAVETDKILAANLQKQEPIWDKKLHVQQQDIRTANLEQIFHQQPYKVVANLPYNITSWFTRFIFEAPHKPQTMTLLLQKEVAERMVAKPGKMSLLALSVQYYSQPTITRIVPRVSFWPQPEVDSAVIHFAAIKEHNFAYKKELFRLAKIAFAGKRKQMHNTIKSGLKLSKPEAESLLKAADIAPTARPQELGLQDWKRLAKYIATKDQNML